MINNTWKVNEGDRTYAKGWSNKEDNSKQGGFKPPQKSNQSP